MKTYVITLAKQFPGTHPKKGLPTGFAAAFLSGEKIHTIRGNYDYWAPKLQEVIEGKAILSVREWIDRPYRKPGQRLIASIGASSLLGFQRIFMTHSWCIEASVEYMYSYETNALAKNDGLSNGDFVSWFFPPKKDVQQFYGIIIHFTKFRY